MKLLLRAGILTVATVIAACGGGGGSDGPTVSPGEGNPTTPGGDGDSTSVLAAGYNQGSSFVSEAIQASTTALANGESSTLVVKLALVDSTDNSFTLVEESADIEFSSTCANTGLATITPATSSSDTGNFTATYTNNGCSGEDVVTAEISYNGESVSAEVSLNTSNASIRMGSLVGGIFTEGVISSTPQSTLSAGDSAQLSVRLVDQDNAAYTGAADVFFSSPCINSGAAEVSSAIVSNSSGTVVTTYTNLNCDGTDTVTAISSVGSATLQASTDLSVEEPPLGALQFVSAAPQILMLKGTEGAIDTADDGREIGAQSVVTFSVTSDNGSALPNQQVNFELVTGDSGTGNTGNDAFLSRYTAFTDPNGQVTTVVNPGTTATPIRVRATATRNGIEISAVSSRLVVTTGIPDQDSFSLSVSAFNIDGWAYDGVETDITIRAADRFNNPVPNGTALTFWAEGAAIEPSCVTTGGACTVKLRSQEPRPGTGRVTILARAIGEESFSDTSPTNGRFEDAETFGDLGEPYLDTNENCAFDPGDEKFADFNNDGQRNGGNGLYDGLLCNNNAGNALCNPDSETIFTSAQAVIVLSGSTDLDIDLFLRGGLTLPAIDSCGGDTVNSGSRVPASTLSEVVLDCGQAITVAIEDGRGQVPPAGTTVSAQTSQGELIGPTEYPMGSTNAYGPWLETFFLDPADNAGDGVFTVTVTTPDTDGGASTTYTSLLSVLQRDFEIAADQPGVEEENIQIDTVDGATVQLSIKEANDLGFPTGSTVKLSLTQGSISNGDEFVIPNNQLGTFRRNIEIAPSGSEGFGFLTVTLQTPQAEGCNAEKVYLGEFQVEEVTPAPAP